MTHPLATLQGRARQGGFTMVELAIVLVIAGIILVAALKGTDMINKAKIERAVQDIRGIQTMVFEHEKRTGRLAGDCNGDGIINVTAGTLQVVRLAGTAYDDNADPTAGTGPACVNSSSAETDLNTPWKDVRKANIVDPSRINRQITKNQTNNFYGIGAWNVNSVPSNVITVYDIPLWMAKGIDVAIDGAGVAGTAPETAGASGRVRLLHDGTTSTPNGANWPTGDANDDQLVSIFFQFDRLAP
ncbi:type IV pilin protein [Azovibrio restrictus]|uniref:type IV pilin protein n=1 Tax=Azovibrio restrictus TaxID=146938 RepID=UPI0026F1634B|nr:prepilin-type N-terminal cleavage/methylation domain-containing protein [Azovibrio restrictus]MDD3483661.1 prepilin-type N-terminal cleavage/methylation domain-containing protein [Azovibrio restrictus]